MKNIVVIRGAGELATGVAHRMHKSGFKVLMLEQEAPSAVRRGIVFAEAMYDGEKEVERVLAKKAYNLQDAKDIIKAGHIAVMADPIAACVKQLKPHILVDAIYAKRNLGTRKDMADLVIGVGPGFCAGRDVHCVIETLRGHNLGRIIREGHSMLDTEEGQAQQPIKASCSIYAPVEGTVENGRALSFIVHKDDVVAYLCDGDTKEIKEIKAPVDGVLRGVVHDGLYAHKGLKIAEIDPSTQPDNCFTISAKSRCIAGSVLEVAMTWKTQHDAKKKGVHRFIPGR